jgi:hypothetical protein
MNGEKKKLGLIAKSVKPRHWRDLKLKLNFKIFSTEARLTSFPQWLSTFKRAKFLARLRETSFYNPPFIKGTKA